MLTRAAKRAAAPKAAFVTEATFIELQIFVWQGPPDLGASSANVSGLNGADSRETVVPQ